MTRRVLHVITSLNPDGAQQAMLRLLQRIQSDEWHHEIVSLTNVGPLAEKFDQLGIGVRALRMTPRNAPIKFGMLLNHIYRGKPDIIQTWLYHGDLLGGFAGWLAGRCPIVWNIRHSNLDPGLNKRATMLCAKACARLSKKIPIAIICNSQKGRDVHIQYGYNADKIHVIPNGYDTNQFRPDSSARMSLRHELGILNDNVPLVGMIGRYHPQKDHKTFFEAMAISLRDYPDFHVVLCGDRIDGHNGELGRFMQKPLMAERCHLLGQRADMVRIMQAIDILVMSSRGEGFPNVVAEAMACGVACVVTDVGDAAEIVGSSGLVVSPQNPSALAQAVLQMLSLSSESRKLLGLQARRRIQEHYSIDVIAESYKQLYARSLRREH